MARYSPETRIGDPRVFRAIGAPRRKRAVAHGPILAAKLPNTSRGKKTAFRRAIRPYLEVSLSLKCFARDKRPMDSQYRIISGVGEASAEKPPVSPPPAAVGPSVSPAVSMPRIWPSALTTTASRFYHIAKNTAKYGRYYPLRGIILRLARGYSIIRVPILSGRLSSVMTF